MTTSESTVSDLDSDKAQERGSGSGNEHLNSHLERSASQEGYYPEGLIRTMSEELVGGSEMEHYEEAEAEDEESSQAHEPRSSTEKFETKTSRRSSITQRMEQKFGILDNEIRKERMETIFAFLKVYLMMWVFMLTAFSLYWGSYYNRSARYKNLKMLIVNGDFQEVDSVPPLIGSSIEQTSLLPSIAALGNWKLMNSTELEDAASSHGNSIEEEVMRLVHHQEYWSAIYIRPNSTYDYLQAYKSLDTSFNTSGTLVKAYYETGRDLLTMGSYVIPFVKQFQSTWLSSLSQTFYPPLIELLSNQEKINLVTRAPELLTSLPVWNLDDMRPSPSSVIVAPYQIGCIYLVIITFFQFNFFAAVHQKVSGFLKMRQFILYRMISSQVSYLILSLGYSCVSAAFQVDFNISYKGGFGVYWMIAYLTMAAVGGMNENMAMICFCTYPPLLGFWILSWVVLNISPTFSAMALTSPLFRFGYGIPIHNSAEAFKVILFDTYRGQIGRNVGILIAWIVINNLTMPFVMKFFGKRMRAKAMAAAKAGK